MKNLLLGLILLLTTNAFTQELNNYHKKVIIQEMADMIKIMELSNGQEHRMHEILTARAHAAIAINKLEKNGEATRLAWGEHKIKYSEKTMAAVSKEQWNKWVMQSEYGNIVDPFIHKKLKAEVEEMTEVMELSTKQVNNLVRIRTEKALDETKIIYSFEEGSDELAKARTINNLKFKKKTQATVSRDQWNEWVAYNCASCNRKAWKDKHKNTEQTTSLKKELGEIDLIIDEMAEVMSLYPEQKDVVREIKTQLIIDNHNLYWSTEDSPERKAAFKKLTQDSNKKIREATSDEQMEEWWAYWGEKNNK